MAFGDVDPTVAVLRIILPCVAACVAAPTCWWAHRQQPGTWLTTSTIGLHFLVLSTAALNFVQLLVSAESMWGTARVANVFNGAGCISLLLTSHCCWLLAAQVFAVTPWSTKSGIGKLYRIINRPGHGSWPKRTFAALLVCSLVGSVVPALLQVVVGQAPSPSFKLCIYLSFPGFGGLLAALMLTAHGGLD